MDRRTFSRQLASGLGALPLFGPANRIIPSFLKARRLREGDVVYLIAPGSPVEEEKLQLGVTNMEALGLRPRLGKHVLARRGFTAGTDAQRLEDLHAAFEDVEAKGVWCIRGGYGCSRLLPNINYRLIRQNPKVLIGYSDITALLQAIHQKTGLICFHGPVGVSPPEGYTPYTLAQVRTLLMEAPPRQVIPVATAQATAEGDHYRPEAMVPGRASGPLAGGNLSLLAALAGTPYGLDATGKLVFIEDVGEKPYRLDRMLTQLRQASNLAYAKGILLGVFSGCDPDPDDDSLSLKETLTDRLGDLGIPVMYGLSFGHVDNMCTLPVGIRASFDTEGAQVVIEEAAVA